MTRALRCDAILEVGPMSLRFELETDARRVAISGPSGAGKTTCLRIVAGLERRARGRVVVDGETWMDTEQRIHVAPWQRRVGWVPQHALLFPHRSVQRNLAFAGATEEEVGRVARMLEVEGLLQRRPRNLSGGEQQRVALGRALLASPRTLLLDEPFAALDAPLRHLIAERLAEHCEERDLLVIVVSHDTAASEVLVQEHWALVDGGIRPGARLDLGGSRD